ncbi:MAG: 50S ribosomal protein L11 methyltransferase [Chlamydiota bacterium]
MEASEYLQFSFTVNPDKQDFVEECLEGEVEVLWSDSESHVAGVIPLCSKDALKHKLGILEEQFELPPIEVVFKELQESDWYPPEQYHFAPIRVGNFYLVDRDASESAPPECVPIVIDAKMAFGSGHHQTTQGCLNAIKDIADKEYAIDNALDIGCGTGVLAIALAKIMGIPVYATDTEEECVKKTLENARVNGVFNLEAYQGYGVAIQEVQHAAPYDLIVANILANPLCDLAEAITDLMSEKGIIVLSGIWHLEAERVEKCYQECGCRVIKRYDKDQWATIMLSKN